LFAFIFESSVTVSSLGANVESLDTQILEFLPADGSPVLNRVVRALLSRANQSSIDTDTYFAAIARLVSSGRIGRTRGQGGKVFLVLSDETVSDDNRRTEKSAWSETKLMTCLQAYLDGPFRKALDLPPNAGWIVANTASIGPKTGRWARPDFVTVNVMRFHLLPDCQVNVHSFELKTELGGTLQAVHEALAQTRFTHFGHMVWHLPMGSKAEARLPEIVEQCEMHGIGLILIRSPELVESWEIILDPRKKTTPPEIVDGFLETRLSFAQRDRLHAMVFGER
jgi:hypothetical protein